MTIAKPRTPPRPLQAQTESETVTTGKGMPTKRVRADRKRLGSEQTLHDAAVEASLELPHERDQITDMTADKPDPTIKQAKRDVDRGLKDTSKSLEMDNIYQKLK